MKIIIIFPYKDSAGVSAPTLLSLPDSSLLRSPNPFFIPEFDTRFTARPFMACRISKLGKSVNAKFARRYWSEVAPAFCITAENLLYTLHSQGLPWTEATGFDRSMIIGDFVDFQSFTADLQLERPGEGPTALKMPSADDFNRAIERVAATNMIKTGDLILLPLYDSSHNIPAVDLTVDTDLQISSGQNILTLAKIR